MNKNGHSVTFLPLLLTPPSVTLADVTKPTDTSSAETLGDVKVPTGAQLKALLLDVLGSSTALFGGMTLDAGICASIPDDWYLAYYLNVRYARAMPPEMIPVRNKHRYNSNDWVLAPLLVNSVILTELFDQTRNTINPTVKFENDCIRRTLTQVNYVILTILQRNPNGRRPNNNLIVSSAQVVSPRDGESTFDVWFDAQALAEWEDSGRTMQEAMDHWFLLRTQPNA